MGQSLILRFLDRIVTVVTWRPRLTVLVAFLLAAFSLFYTATHLEFKTEQLDLISPENRLVQLAGRLRQFDKLDKFIVAIDNHDPQRARLFLQHLTNRLKADTSHYAELFYRVDPQGFEPWALLYLDQQQLEKLIEGLTENRSVLFRLCQHPSLVFYYQLLNENIARALMDEFFTGFLYEEKDDDEILNFSFLTGALTSLNSYLKTGRYISSWNSFIKSSDYAGENQGYFTTENGQYLLLFVTPRAMEEGFIGARTSLARLRLEIRAVQKDFPDIEVGVTGPEALSVDEMNASMGCMGLATAISAAGLTLLLILFWRSFRRPLFEMFELLVALSLTFGLTTLVIGHLNILSVVFAPLLLGLGIDYGIHWLARYQEFRQDRSLSTRAVIHKTVMAMGPGVLLAGTTAALSFFPLVLTDFQGIVELGIICSMGMIMTTLTTTCLLPALVLAFDRPAGHRKAKDRGRPFLPLTSGRARFIIAASVFVSCISLFNLSYVKFDLNMLNIQAKNAESVIWEKRLLADSQRSSMYGAILVPNLKEVRQKSAALENINTVSEVHSILTLLPDNQKSKLTILKKLEPLLPASGNLRGSLPPVDLHKLEKTLAGIRFKFGDSSQADGALQKEMDRVRNLAGDLLATLRSNEGTSLQSRLNCYQEEFMADLAGKLDILRANSSQQRPMTQTDIPPSLFKRFVSDDNRYLIRVFPAGNIWDPDFLAAFVHDLQSVDPDAIGDPVTLSVFTKAFRDACIKASGYALLFIAGLLLVTLRSLRLVMLAMLPLVAGTIWAGGLMKWAGISLNVANSLFLPLIVGAGVEYGIIILQRWRQLGYGTTALPFSTGKGIILAGLTTVIGFGSLVLCDHQGTASLGILAALGSVCVMLAAVFFLPSVLFLLSGESSRRKEQ